MKHLLVTAALMSTLILSGGANAVSTCPELQIADVNGIIKNGTYQEKGQNWTLTTIGDTKQTDQKYPFTQGTPPFDPPLDQQLVIHNPDGSSPCTYKIFYEPKTLHDNLEIVGQFKLKSTSELAPKK